ncbi:hypothetical protein LCGC14_2016560, partial [marine sediment metagenome]
MLDKKAQVEIRELLLTIVIAGVLFIVGLLIFSNVSNTADNILDPTVNTARNETVAITINSGADNSTLLAQSRVLSSGITVRNASNQSEIITRNTDYTVTLTGTSGDEGVRANFTWINT